MQDYWKLRCRFKCLQDKEKGRKSGLEAETIAMETIAVIDINKERMATGVKVAD